MEAVEASQLSVHSSKEPTSAPRDNHFSYQDRKPPPLGIKRRMLRSHLPRAVPSASALRCSLQKSSPISRNRLLEPQRQQARFASAQHAISNPTLAGIEKRWEQMPPQEQAELWMQLRDRMKVDWHELTMQEKKAGMFVHARFSHGCRSQDRRPIRVPLVCPKHPFLMALTICPLSIITDLTS